MTIKKILALVLATIGLLAVILGLIAYGLDTGYYEVSSAYGGDAYTGIQNAAAQTANNVRYVTEAIASVGGSILLITGLVLMVVGVKSCVEELGSFADKQLFSIPVPAAPAEPAEPAAPVAPAENAFCPNCGAAKAEGAGFCAECGTKLS